MSGINVLLKCYIKFVVLQDNIIHNKEGSDACFNICKHMNLPPFTVITVLKKKNSDKSQCSMLQVSVYASSSRKSSLKGITYIVYEISAHEKDTILPLFIGLVLVCKQF